MIKKKLKRGDRILIDLKEGISPVVLFQEFQGEENALVESVNKKTSYLIKKASIIKKMKKMRPWIKMVEHTPPKGINVLLKKIDNEKLIYIGEVMEEDQKKKWGCENGIWLLSDFWGQPIKSEDFCSWQTLP